MRNFTRMTSVNLSTQQLIKDKASNGFIVELMEMCLYVQRVYHLSSLVWPDRTFCMYCGCTQNGSFSRTSISQSTNIYRGYKPTCRVVDCCTS